MGLTDESKKSSKTKDENTQNFSLRKEKPEEPEESVKDIFLNAIHSGGKHIVINEDFYLTETLEIDVDNILIDGQGHTIEVTRRNTAIMLITSNNVTLKNIVFKKASSDTDGAAINNQTGTLNIKDCKFIGNNAYNSNGGAIYNLQGTLNITNCNFIDNRTERNDGGAIYNFNGEVNIEECRFEDNYANLGGAIYNGNTLNLKDSIFKNNTAYSGPTLFNTFDSLLTLDECSFERDEMHSLKNNFEIHNQGTINIDSSQKEKTEEITKGGFIHIASEHAKSFKFFKAVINSGKKEITLSYDLINKEFKKGLDIDEDDLVIDGNDFIIDGLGKGIFNINGKNITLKNINFRNGSSTEGGAINNNSDSLKLENCNFDCNISNTGGAIDNKGFINIENCNFRKNIANEDNGGAINNKGELKLSDCSFINNHSDEDGGAISNSNTLDITGCKFMSNHAKNGASINNIENASLNLIDAEFKTNKAINQGSVLYNENIVHMEKCNSFNNISSEYNSNIIFQKGNENSKLDIQDCTFSRDKFNNNLIFVENGFCSIDSTKFMLKKEHENSYAIYNKNSVLKVKNLEFKDVNGETIFNDHIMYLENNDNIEKYIEIGENSSPFKYGTN